MLSERTWPCVSCGANERDKFGRCSPCHRKTSRERYRAQHPPQQHRARQAIESRFWRLVDKSQACWLWKGGVSRYGRFNVGVGVDGRSRSNRVVSAHRLAYQLAYGAIPSGLVVCHHCDNPPCVRPEHLFLGTQADNLRDMRLKGRR